MRIEEKLPLGLYETPTSGLIKYYEHLKIDRLYIISKQLSFEINNKNYMNFPLINEVLYSKDVLQNAILSRENQSKKNRLQVASIFQSLIEKDEMPDRYAYFYMQEKTILEFMKCKYNIQHESTYLLKVQSKTNDPLDTPIGALLSVLYKWFMLNTDKRKKYAIISSDPISLYEMGMFRVILQRCLFNMACSFADIYPGTNSTQFLQNEKKIVLNPQPILDIDENELEINTDYFSAMDNLIAYLTMRHVAVRKHLKLPEGNAVACLIADGTGRVIGYGLNTTGEDRHGSVDVTAHAEINALRNAFAISHNKKVSVLPPKSKIFTALKPCEMCAGALFEAFNPSSPYLVRYLLDDPKQKKTAFDLAIHKTSVVLHKTSVSVFQHYEKQASLIKKQKSVNMAKMLQDVSIEEIQFQEKKLQNIRNKQLAVYIKDLMNFFIGGD